MLWMRSALNSLRYAWKVLRHKQFANGGVLPRSTSIPKHPIEIGHGIYYRNGKFYRVMDDVVERYYFGE